MTQTRRRLKNLGYTAGGGLRVLEFALLEFGVKSSRARRFVQTFCLRPEDMPKLFKKFDKDGNGDLEMEEFCEAQRTWSASHADLVGVEACNVELHSGLLRLDSVSEPVKR